MSDLVRVVWPGTPRWFGGVWLAAVAGRTDGRADGRTGGRAHEAILYAPADADTSARRSRRGRPPPTNALCCKGSAAGLARIPNLYSDPQINFAIRCRSPAAPASWPSVAM